MIQSESWQSLKSKKNALPGMKNNPPRGGDDILDASSPTTLYKEPTTDQKEPTAIHKEPTVKEPLIEILECEFSDEDLILYKKVGVG